MTVNPQFAADAAWLESECGIVMPFAADYMPREYRRNFNLAMDAQPTLVTQPSAGIPSWLTQYVDPEPIRVLQAKNLGAQILDERKNGDWTMQTAWFPMIENVGEVSSYGDLNENAMSDVNINYESRTSYLFQTIIEYGDLEVERFALTRLNLVAEKNLAAAKTLDKFMDYTYHFGVQGIANYGVLNDPSLPPAITPSTKAAGGVKWVGANGQITATAQEIYGDFQTLYSQLTSPTYGTIDMNAKLKFVTPSTVNSALTAVNQFGITIRKFITDSFPNVEFISDPRYATAAGNVVQLIATEFDGNETGYMAFSEKMRDHRIVPAKSSFQQKKTAGSWGAIVKYPMAFATMLGV